MDGWTDWLDGWMDGWMDGYTRYLKPDGIVLSSY